MRLENIPSNMAGKNDEAASPNAKATVAATKPGGLMKEQQRILSEQQSELDELKSMMQKIIERL